MDLNIPPFRCAVLDLYDGTPNQGLRAIRDILSGFKADVIWEEFDVRAKNEIPGLDFDIYICTGGPGNPLEGDGIWDKAFYSLIQDLWENNLDPAKQKKYVLFICHSFQIACHHFGVGRVIPRRSRSFGTFPCHKTFAGISEPYFQELPDPFCVADFRNFQVVQPDYEVMERLGAQLLALEKKRLHVDLERAMMAVRFSDEMFGTQFHPEADPEGMILHFEQQEQKNMVIKEHGIQKFYQMIKDLRDPEKIKLTHSVLIPSFLNDAITVLKSNLVNQSN